MGSVIPINRQKCSICGKQARATLEGEVLCGTHYSREKQKRARAASLSLIEAIRKKRIVDPNIEKIIAKLHSYYRPTGRTLPDGESKPSSRKPDIKREVETIKSQFVQALKRLEEISQSDE